MIQTGGLPSPGHAIGPQRIQADIRIRRPGKGVSSPDESLPLCGAFNFGGRPVRKIGWISRRLPG
jgi:hypothetical protein